MNYDELEEGVKVPDFWLFGKLTRKLQHALHRLPKLFIEEFCERFDLKVFEREVENIDMQRNWYQG